MRSSVLLFAVFCLLGGAGAWFWLQLALSRAAAQTSSPPPPAQINLDGWDWRRAPTPEPLPRDTVSTAIAAWLALRGPDGGPAPFALRAEALHALLARLRPEDIPRLLTPLFADASPSSRRLHGIAFNLLTELDPAAAARWATSAAQIDEEQARWLAQQAFEAWAKKDPAAALAWARTLPNQDLARNFAGTILLKLAKIDPATAFHTCGDLVWKQNFISSDLSEAFGLWIQRDPTAALVWFAAQPQAPNSFMTAMLLGRSKLPSDPRDLLAAANALPDLRFRENAVWLLTQNWGRAQPEAAIAWIQALPDASLRNTLLENFVALSRSDEVEKALPFALALPQGANRTSRIGELIASWADRDPSAALAWMKFQDDPAVRAAAPKAQVAILGAIARDEPATALAEWKALTDPQTKNAALAPILEAWSRKDPGAALRWLQTQPAELVHGTHVAHQALYPWSLKEPEAALRWAEENAPPAWPGIYLQALAGDGQTKADRAAVSTLYAKIADPALRTEVLTAHVREWLTKDRPAAQAWLESTSALTPEQAAALLAPAL